MKVKLLFLILSLTNTIFIFSQQVITFRGYNWRTSINEIMKNEHELPETYSTNNYYSLTYNRNMAGYNAEVIFSFYNNQLYRGTYELILPKNRDDVYYMDIYKDLQNKLISLYGEQNIYRNDPPVYNENQINTMKTARFSGSSIVTIWMTPPYNSHSNLSLMLSYSNIMECWSISISYFDPEHYNGWRSELNTEGL